MIKLTRLNGTPFYLNAELVEQVESTPDTVITTIAGNNFVVREKIDVVIAEIVEYRLKVGADGKLSEGMESKLVRS
jgi:flagellar protein FlbD